MLFNSHLFLFAYLPIVAAGFFFLGSYNRRYAACWLAASSLFFYGWWNPAYVVLLLVSMSFNFLIAIKLGEAPQVPGWGRRRVLFSFALLMNLATLGYYKYADFFLQVYGHFSGGPPELLHIVLPLGISFFTFTQIAFLADVYAGKSSEPSPLDYCLFVTYFPHLIAGPVLHHREMMPQFQRAESYRFSVENVSIGLSIFSIGLFKKVGVADSLSPYSNSIFNAVSAGYSPTFLEAWAGALAYTLQLYFDFSGYSDMAIGLSRIFNVKLPLNFNSPYQASNIIEFWRRWHMTLSRFLRDYLYIPLGGSRGGRVGRYRNLMITMLLGGLWHGAGWTFIVWGGLHGAYLVTNHAWRWLTARVGVAASVLSSRPWGIAARLLTFSAVILAWVVFRADNLHTAISMWQGMFGMNGLVFQEQWFSQRLLLKQFFVSSGVQFHELPLLQGVKALYWMLPLVLACWVLPNTQELMSRYQPALDFRRTKRAMWLNWRPSVVSGISVGLLAGFCVLYISRKSEFLYFQF